MRSHSIYLESTNNYPGATDSGKSPGGVLIGVEVGVYEKGGTQIPTEGGDSELVSVAAAGMDSD